MYENFKSNAQKGLGINFTTFKLFSKNIFSNEVHQLFPIMLPLTRLASKDMQLKDIFVPKGLVLEILVLHMHHDPQLWGENVMEFDPNRFAKGTSKVCQHQQSFIPFFFGP